MSSGRPPMISTSPACRSMDGLGRCRSPFSRSMRSTVKPKAAPRNSSNRPAPKRRSQRLYKAVARPATAPAPSHVWLYVKAPYQSANGSVTKMVSSRSGEVESMATGQSISSSTRRTYLIASAGNSPHVRAPTVLSDQPFMVS